MQHLSIDIETYSSVNLQKAGVYKYAESPDFDILLFGYSVDGGAVHVIDLACGEKIPAEMRDRLPVVAVGSEILWIPGGRMNEKYKITSTTGRVLELHYQGGALA